MIPDDEVARVRESADIVAIIGEHVPLRRTGSDYRGPCPFHQGKHRNFSVSPKKGMYYCFVCGAGGDVFNFLQKHVGMDWPSAVRTVAEKSGIELHETKSRREGPDPREPLWEANAAASEYFQRVLWQDELGAPAREYLESRGITRALAERFSLGYAPREIGLMRAALAALGIADARMLDAGLLIRREESEEPRPRFRARLTFPIADASGRIAGFGGRLIAPGEPKYLNSGESPIYSKGKLLYNLHQARHAIRRDDRVLVVEGYFDVVRLVGAGIESVVAPLGTALTDEQAKVMVRYTKNAFLLYDSDKAGLKATFRAGDELLAEAATVRVVSLPNGDDPDTFVQKQGGDALERQISQALDVFERKIQLLERGGWFADLTRRRAAIDRLLPTIRATRDPLLRDMYVGRTSQASGVDRAVLAREAGDTPTRPDGVRHASRPTEPAQGLPGAGRAAPPPSASVATRGMKRGANGGHSAERHLIAGMLKSSAVVDRVLERVGPDSFREPQHQEIFVALRDLGSAEHVEALAERLSPEAIALLNELLADPDAILDVDRTVDDSLARLEERRLGERNKQIDREVEIASDDEKDVLIREKQENARLIRELRALRERQ